MDTNESVDSDLVLFQAPLQSSLAPGEFEQHNLKDLARGLFGRKLQEVKADWSKVSSQIAQMIQATETAQPTGFGLDSVEVSLGFNAKGQLVFVAEAGVEATVSVTFKRTS